MFGLLKGEYNAIVRRFQCLRGVCYGTGNVLLWVQGSYIELRSAANGQRHGVSENRARIHVRGPRAQMPFLVGYEIFSTVTFLESRGTDQSYLIGLDSSLGLEMFDDF